MSKFAITEEISHQSFIIIILVDAGPLLIPILLLNTTLLSQGCHEAFMEFALNLIIKLQNT